MESSPAKRRKLDHQPQLQPAQPAQPGPYGAAALDAAAIAGTFRPGAFVLQAQELLDEVRLDYDKAFPGADDLLHQIKSSIEAIQPQDPTPVSARPAFKTQTHTHTHKTCLLVLTRSSAQLIKASAALQKRHNVLVPFPDPSPPEDCPYKVSYAKPARFNVVGSYISRTMVRSQSRRCIDMVVEMPREIFQEKDYLNLRYFYKRAYYLAVLSAAVRDALAKNTSAAYEHADGNQLLPVLVLTSKPPSRESGEKSRPAYHIRIIPCAPEGLFAKHKLLPTTSCIRAAPEGESPAQAPTPFYNSTLKAESTHLSYLKVLRHAEKSCPAFRDACMLGRVWLQQRGLGGSVSQGGFGNFEWSLLTALLLQGGGRKGARALSPSLSSTQIFKALIQYLAAADLAKKPLIFGSSKEDADAAREPVPVIFDVARQLNLAYKMSLWSASLLQHFAQWTHTSLADREADQFNPTFIIKADSPLQCFDLLIRIDQAHTIGSANPTEYRGASWGFCDRVARILNKALGDRAHFIHLQNAGLAGHAAWDIASPSASEHSAVLVGIVFNNINMARQVDHGPTVEEKDAGKKFRQFWGGKAELRRFKDGSILESLIWTQASPSALGEEITRYILKLHLGMQDEDLHFFGKGFPSVVPIRQSDTPSFQAARQAFTVFERDLRDLSNLPLQIRQVAATGPELRFASVRAPQLGASKGTAQPMDTIIYFEASGKWPESLAAIQRTKTAFLLKIGEMLAESKPGVTCRVGLEETKTEMENIAYLDVSYDDGAIFRLRVHSDLEESLLDRRTKDKTLDQRVRTQGAQLLASFKRVYTHLRLHTQTVATFCSRFPALSPTIRLVKQWFDSHKLSCHFLEEMIELLALKVFLEPYPWQAPSSTTTGFLRTLQFLSRWDWRTEPLILDPSSTLSGPERSAVETRLEAWRKIDPGMSHTTLFVATSHDASGTAYTIHEGHPFPPKVVATRMTSLARSACALVRDKGIDVDPKSLFQPSLKDYDVVIHLSSRALKSIGRGDDGTKQSQFKNLDGRTGNMPQPTVQQPARALLHQLEALFSGPLVLFHGSPDDAVIAGIWNPQVRRRTFRVNLPCSFRPIGLEMGEESQDGGELVEMNRDGIIAEIARVGGDCIDRIDLPKQS